MPRKSVFPPQIKHHKPTNQARIYWKGKHYYFGVFGSEKSEEKYQRFIARLSEGKKGGGRDKRVCHYSIKEVCAKWMVHAKERYGEDNKELKDFLYSINPMIREFGKEQADSFDAGMLEEVGLLMANGDWLTRKEKEYRRQYKIPIGICRTTVNRRLTRIKTMWKWAERKKLVPTGSYHNLTTLPGFSKNDKRMRITPKRKPIPWHTLKQIVKEMPSPVREMILFQWWTGCRSCEVRLMKIEEIDTTGKVWIYRPTHHKTEHLGQDRVILIGPKAQSVLRSNIDSDNSGLVFTIPKSDGRGYTDFSYAQAFRRARIRAGIVDPYVPYCCRHAARMRIARIGGDEAARAVLGHKSIDTTMHYGVLDLDLAEKIMGKVG